MKPLSGRSATRASILSEHGGNYMVSLKGYESLNHSAASLLSSLHSSISAAKTDNRNQPVLSAEIAEYSGLTGRFYSDLLTILMQGVDEAFQMGDAIPGWVIANIENGIEQMTKQIHTVDFIRHMRSDSISAMHFWQMPDGNYTEAEPRKIMFDLLRQYRKDSMALIDGADRPRACLIHKKGRSSDSGEAKECIALDIGELLDATPTTRMKKPLPNPLVLSGEALGIVLSTGQLIAALLDLHDFTLKAGKPLFAGLPGATTVEPKKPQPKIRATDEAKFPIGLFG